MRPQTLPAPFHPHLLGAALLWLLVGSALLLSTLVPLHTEGLGWTPAFWLLGAPLIALLGLVPRVPRRRRMPSRARRHPQDRLVWH